MIPKVTIDGMNYDLDTLCQSARGAVFSLQIMGDQIQRKRNEWMISDAARNT